jgi:pimeloyl-ACP methyl ester carboxylesterase
MAQSSTIRLFLLTNLVRDSETKKMKFRVPIDILGRAMDTLGDFPFKDPAERRFDGPTLIVRGTKSHYIADDVLPVVGEFFPRFKLQDIDSGHWVISEKPEEFRRGESPCILATYV